MTTPPLRPPLPPDWLRSVSLDRGEDPGRILADYISAGSTILGSGFRSDANYQSSEIKAGRTFDGPFVDNNEMKLRCEDLNERRTR